MRSCGYIVPPQTSVHKSQNHWNLIAQKDHFPSLCRSPTHNLLTLHLGKASKKKPGLFSDIDQKGGWVSCRNHYFLKLQK